MTKQERAMEVFDRTDRAITMLRLIRSQVQKGKHVDHSDFTELAEMIASLRHHCEQHNDERLYPDK